MAAWPDTTMHPLLAPRADLPALAARFDRDGRVQVPGVLEAGFSQALSGHVAQWRQWALVTNLGGRHRNFDGVQMDGLDPAKRAAFDEMVAAQARNGFQYLYERYPLHDPHVPMAIEDALLRQAAGLLQDDAFLGLARTICGRHDIRHADGQLTRYRRHHFLTRHDDHDDGKQRVAAYVIGLTPDWQADYGGQLQFLTAEGDVEAALVPKPNVMNIFRVPVPHLVSAVAPFVEGGRCAITGWFRAD